jgi:hypothetical protein
MVPDTTTIEVRNGVIEWRNADFMISADEAASIAETVRDTMRTRDVNGIIVDNSGASGTWPSETDEVWDSLMEDIYTAGIECATICPSVTNSMHVNRLSKDNGTHDRIRAFKPDEESAAYEFVGVAPV